MGDMVSKELHEEFERRMKEENTHQNRRNSYNGDFYQERMRK